MVEDNCSFQAMKERRHHKLSAECNGQSLATNKVSTRLYTSMALFRVVGGGGGFVPPFRDFNPSKLNTAYYMHAPKMSFDMLLPPPLGDFPK